MNIDELVQSTECSLLLIYKNRFSIKQILGNSDFLGEDVNNSCNGSAERRKETRARTKQG